MAADRSIEVLVGTAKGLFILRSRGALPSLSLAGPFLPDAEVTHAIRDPRDGTILAAANSPFYGPSVRRSRDGGQTWDAGGAGLAYAADDPEKVTRVWHIAPGPAATPGRIYAGVEASGLFVSEDGGDHWSEVASLRRHPTHAVWEAGGGGKCLHTVIVHPADPDRVFIACSTGGVYVSEDGGETWEPRNRGLRADFLPEPQRYPEAGQCVHRIALCARRPERLYLQNHGGVYRSDDGGRTWIDVSLGLPSDFGFPVLAHPRHPDTAYVVPVDAERARAFPGGRGAVWRTDDGGQSWRPLARGLPEPAFTGVLRGAFAHDGGEPLGLYLGTTSGSLFVSPDEGETWHEVARHLPRILSVEAGPA
ncbi:MAG: exo-alpha-sialidase [Clostridia bacterium]|nr:exo-alpha-sialidase [Clostridia bacterium]